MISSINMSPFYITSPFDKKKENKTKLKEKLEKEEKKKLKKKVDMKITFNLKNIFKSKNKSWFYQKPVKIELYHWVVQNG